MAIRATAAAALPVRALRTLRLLIAACGLALLSSAQAQVPQQVVDIPTRPGITQRMVLLSPPQPRAAVVLLPGGHGGLQIFANGSMKWGEGNFLVRTRQLFAAQGLAIAVVDAPSDRQVSPFLAGFRQTPQHAADMRAVIAWMRENYRVPVWLVGTSRGTQSAAYVATELSGADAPDGIVLSSTILSDDKGRSVLAMPLDKISIPTLVVHHEQDGCTRCPFSKIPELMDQLQNAADKQVLSFQGGLNTGDPCAAYAYHGFNGLESDVVRTTAAWILAR
ncbi:MAG: alpha/beta hydrolase [Burkholderiaceae bacterium]